MSDGKVTIEQRENGPLVVKNLGDLRLANGTAAECKPVMAPCRIRLQYEAEALDTAGQWKP